MHHQPASRYPEQAPMVVPSRTDPLLSAMTEPVGGPMGTHAQPGRISPGFFSVERVLVIMTAISALLAILTKSHCLETGWTTPDQYSTGCYSVFPNALPPLSGKSWSLDEGPVTGVIASLTWWISSFAGTVAPRGLAFFDINALLIAVAWICVVLLIWRMSGRRPWDAALVAASPLLILTAYTSWDFWAAALVTFGVYLFARRRPLSSGFVLGGAAMAGPYAALILLAVVALGLREKKVKQTLEVMAAGAAAWVLVMVPSMTFDPSGWGSYLGGMVTDPPSDSSLYGAWNLLAGVLGAPPMGVGTANTVAFTLLLVVVLGVGFLAVLAPKRPRVAQLAAIIVGGFLVVGKFTEPWHALWLLPLLALAIPRWRPLLLWQAAMITSVIAWMLYQSKSLGNISDQHAIDAPFFVLASLIGAGAIAAIVGIIVAEVWNPRRDVVRRRGFADPQGGFFNDSDAEAGSSGLETSAVASLPAVHD